MSLEPSEQPFAIGSVVAGKLRIIRAVGVGGMGAVFEVEHEITRHRRALKLLHAQMAELPGVVERFLREASAAGRIGNPHIVETFDAGRLESGEPYIVMELLRGKTLADELRTAGPLDIATACDVFIQACDGVAAAHAAGIIHRDLKPDNLFLCEPGGSFVKILDFGISKFDAAITGVEGFTLEGSPMGTPFYMSPEQVRGQKTVDIGTDVYALGVVLYECLTGQRPFDADNLPHLVYLISQGQYTPPSLLRPSLPKPLDAIVAKALALDRAERYASAQDLSHAIARLRQSLAPPALELQPPSGSTPAPESSRGVPALTPDAFSKSAFGAAHLSAQRRTSHRRRWAVGIGGLGIVGVALALGAAHSRRAPQATATTGSVSALTVTHEPSVAANSVAVPSTAPTVTPVPSVVASAVAATTLLPTKSAKPASSVSPAGSSKPQNRAAAVGLSQENPFR